jgi:hypothetical protein
VFLFRPDANAPGSERHPFRAVKLANRSGYTLEPGPIAIFARGSFVGDSLVERIASTRRRGSRTRSTAARRSRSRTATTRSRRA